MKLFMFIMAILIAFLVIYALTKTKKPYKTAFKSAVSGLSALLFVNLISGRTGCYIGVNTATVFISTILSVPGVICLLIMKLIYHY